jgi:DNA-binding transcriptional MerR regulator
MEPKYFNTREAARRFGISVRTLELWREKRRGPVYYRVGQRVLYSADDLESYIISRAVRPNG